MYASAARDPWFQRPSYAGVRAGAFRTQFFDGGVYAALRSDYRLAVLCVFAAAFLDSLDGRLARVTQTASEFGREYDSLADVITFGVAPAFLVYSWGLYELERVGWILPLFYLVSTATRLARFNVQTKIVDARWLVQRRDCLPKSHSRSRR